MRNPCLSRRAQVVLSLLRFRSIFAFQKALFDRGRCPQLGHPCQKQPSTNTASLWAGKRKSGLPIIPLGLIFHPWTPARTNANRNRRSVVRLSLPRTARIAEERSGAVPANLPPGSFDLNERSTFSNSLVVERGYRRCKPEQLSFREIVSYPPRQALPRELQLR